MRSDGLRQIFKVRAAGLNGAHPLRRRHGDCRGCGAAGLVNARDAAGGELDDLVGDGEHRRMVRGDDDGFALVAELLQ